MKIKILVCWLIVSSLMLLSVACTRKVTETSVTSTEAATETISTTLGEVTETIDPFLPPSPQELAKNNFALPDISRVLCEQLKMMMDEGNNFVLVDTRTNATFKLGFLPGAINIPEDDSSPLFTEEWVNNQLKTLPTNRMIIFYCD